jgi:hypothetical protein
VRLLERSDGHARNDAALFACSAIRDIPDCWPSPVLSRRGSKQMTYREVADSTFRRETNARKGPGMSISSGASSHCNRSPSLGSGQNCPAFFFAATSALVGAILITRIKGVR